jgi:heme-degrading monooxygenase HmoA
VWPHEHGRAEYLEIAARLMEDLRQIDGFISVERFQSLVDPQKLLSLSFWRDEEAVKAWRTFELHREAQDKGRKDLFASYRLRIGPIARDYGPHERHQAPKD